MFLKQNISSSFLKGKLEKLRSQSQNDKNYDILERKAINIASSFSNTINENPKKIKINEKSRSLHFGSSEKANLECSNEKPSRKKNKNEPSNVSKINLIPTLRGELLCFPPDLKHFNELFNSSFVPFNEIHKKSPDLYPILNYIPKKELDELEDKRKKEENLTAIDKFFRELKRGSIKKNVSNEIFSTFRDATQIQKEINHNINQKKIYEDFVKNEEDELNEQIYSEYREKNKK